MLRHRRFTLSCDFEGAYPTHLYGLFPMHFQNSLYFLSLSLALGPACSMGHSDHFLGTGGSPGGGEGEPPSDGSYFPEDLPNTALEENGSLVLIAFTLLESESGPELYAAVRNDGKSFACDAGMTTNFVNKAEELVATVSSTLESGRLFQLEEGSSTIIQCIAPGQIAMTGSTDLPRDLNIEELSTLQHRFPAFILDSTVLVESVTIDSIEEIDSLGQSVFTGTFTNGLNRSVEGATVAIYPVNRVGRPLGRAVATSSSQLVAGETWSFQTSAVDPGFSFAAYLSTSR